MKETTHDICFLHNETFFAAAQRKYVYIYDKRGIEIHCLKVRGAGPAGGRYRGWTRSARRSGTLMQSQLLISCASLLALAAGDGGGSAARVPATSLPAVLGGRERHAALPGHVDGAGELEAVAGCQTCRGS